MTFLAAATPDLSYSWNQALSDLGQVSAIAALTGFMLFAIVAELALPRPRRAGVVAMVAVTGYAYSLGTAGFRWLNGLGGPAYHGYATGDTFALFFEVLFAVLGILTVAVGALRHFSEFILPNTPNASLFIVIGGIAVMILGAVVARLGGEPDGEG